MQAALLKAEKKGKEEVREEGLTEGEKIGVARGEKKNTIEMVRKMIEHGIPVETFAEISCLAIEVIEKLTLSINSE